MFSNYFTIAWRNMMRNRSNALINITGLATGIACCLLIMLWVADEWRYDRWNEKADRTFRASTEIMFGGQHRDFAVTPAPMGPALAADFPEVEAAVRFRDYGGALVEYNNQSFTESRITYCDSSLFQVFSLKMLSGNPEKALTAPNQIVINQSTAQKYFGTTEALGKTLKFDNKRDYTIAGVIEDIPSYSHFNFDFFLPLTGIEEAADPNWLSMNFNTYYVLREGVDGQAFGSKMYDHFIKTYVGPQAEQILGKPYPELEQSGIFVKFHTQALTDIHLRSNREVELGANGNIEYVWLFSIAALFILLIACVNFMNLSTARAATRAREIGVRKVLGSLRSHLINQFLAESILLSAIAFVLALGMARMAMPYFNQLADKQLQMPFVNPLFWITGIGSVILVGLIAGAYPAFYLSSFIPIKSLKGKLFEKQSSFNLRNSLVVFQFFIALVLITGTLVINRQMHYIQSKNLGFNREQLLILDGSEPMGDKALAFKKQLLQNPEISGATITGFLPVPSDRSDSPLCKEAQVREDNCVSMQLWDVDEDYVSTLNMEIVAGRNFSADMPTDSNAVIINETAAKLFGFDNPIGQKVYGGRNFDPASGTGTEPHTIIGVVKDFHFSSLRDNIGALSLWFNPYPSNITLKINTQNPAALINEIERTWKSFAPGLPFNYRFMDEAFDRQYRSERRIGQIFSIFSALSILVACLGLLGLTTFATEQRTKEIGIRKVLGATPANLVALLSKDFLKLVLIAMFIAFPLAWYAMHRWLQEFAYRIDIGWAVFVVAGLAALGIAFATISFQSIKAALANPVKTLRSE